ncbi:2'-deoxycytidine 5'-triphosphate deaminase [Candidatus Gracilibacteria bacterium]|nr:2'-deoxycytidine 5'-triphosphate deaminase [Candidatus Gracilibacteria bacterium]
MILTRHEIRKLIEEGGLKFEPNLDGFQNQPHAVDLRLGTVFYIPKVWKLTTSGREVLTVDAMEGEGDNFEKIELIPGQYFDLAPGESIIASTLEKIELHAPDIMGILYPRSSINRRGLSVDLTGIIDTFYCGNLMIPILNKTTAQIIRIYPGERICQVVFHKLIQELGKEDAMKHGKNSAKYHQADGENLVSKKDTEEEIVFIKSGNLEALKNHKF